ncbi:hypothetical protein BCR35DRAFT_303120 [Leucosporidium creatinivorum]|uniref:BZIP domain-containing protein n=1 Tax=Leucosporidium creatinivorum TaxID=106004 RepID=A0A1Y2FL48_9BASI|nr:hypothetical protein BCR35DRAFT_303120 [Leucosporidium creatinivorum]
MPPRGSRAHSELSGHSMHDSDDEDGAGAGGASGSAGKGKGRKSGDKGGEDQRKIQNRIAQREFRQRKQQYIKDLEARVELASSSRDEQLEQMRGAIKGLIDENQRLRELLAGVGGFIGSGLGGVLPTIGVDLPEFQALISRNRSDRVHELLASNRHDGSLPSTNGHANPSVSPTTTFSNPATATTTSQAQKRRRTTDSGSPAAADPSLSASTGSNGAPPGMTRFDLPPMASTSLVQPPPPPSSSSFFGAGGPSPLPPPPPTSFASSSAYPTASLPFSSIRDAPTPAAAPPPPFCPLPTETSEEQVRRQMAQNEETRMAAGPFTTDKDQATHEEDVQHLFTMPTDNPKLQAIQLISYHMRNKREQPNYHLPPSLKATVTQQTVPHSFFFDGIIFPSLRDRLILLKDQYDLQTLLNDLVDAVDLHENDILIPSNWELSEGFLRKYWYVIDAEVLAISNRWRKERGEPELTMRSIVPDGDGIVAEGALGSRPIRSATA